MKNFTETISQWVAVIAWLAGISMAAKQLSGWLTAAAVLFPPYAWYLVVDHVINRWLA